MRAIVGACACSTYHVCGPDTVGCIGWLVGWWCAYTEYYDQIRDESVTANGYDVAKHLPGPIQDIGTGKAYPSKKEIIAELAAAGVTGLSHLKWMELQTRYCNDNRTVRRAFPLLYNRTVRRAFPLLYILPSIYLLQFLAQR